MSGLSNKHLPSDVDKLTRRDLVELFHIQMAENQQLLKRIAELERDIKAVYKPSEQATMILRKAGASAATARAKMKILQDRKAKDERR